MTLLELHQNYYFHDSILNKLEYYDNELKLYCQFCDFMQDNYNDKDDANSDIIVVFHNAVYKSNGNWKIGEAGFVNQKIEDDSIIFFMDSSSYSTDEVGELIIKASSVEVLKIRTYSL